MISNLDKLVFIIASLSLIFGLIGTIFGVNHGNMEILILSVFLVILSILSFAIEVSGGTDENYVQ